MPNPSVGFVDGLATPVLIKQGLLYYRPEGAERTNWQTADLADLMPEKMLNLPGFCFGEIVASAVQITCGTGVSELSIVRLRPVVPSGRNMWVPATQIATISLGLGRRFAAALSPLLPAPPQDRWAVLFRSNETGSATGGQYRQGGITVGGFGTDRTDVAVWDELIEKPQELVQRAIDSNGASVDPSLAFSDDGSFIVLRWERKIFVASLPAAADGGTLVTAPADGTPFQAPDYLVAGMAPGTWNLRPLLAAVRMAQDGPATKGAGPRWRFSWLLPSGLVVVQSRDDDSMLQVRQPWKPGSRKRADALMFTGAAAGNRLDFSADGRFLTLVRLEWDRKVTKIRIWDLGPEAIGEVEGLSTDVSLVAAACARARLETGSSSFDDGEKITWIGADGAEPCES